MKNKEGITLIALIITIIVLLILAGVSISMVVGENGIMSKAGRASEETKKADAEERVHLEVVGSYDDSGKINLSELNENLRTHLSGVEFEKVYGSGSYTFLEEDEEGITELPVRIKYNETIVDINGSISKDVKLKLPEVGETVKMKPITVNDEELQKEWLYFYSDSSNVYLIYSDNLENNAIPLPESGTIAVQEYNVWSTESREDLLNYLSGKEKYNGIWSNIEQGIEDALKNTVDVTVVGGPTVELFKKCYNSKYPDDEFDVKYYENIAEKDEEHDEIFAKGYYYKLIGNSTYRSGVVAGNLPFHNDKMFFPYENGFTTETGGTINGFLLIRRICRR